MKRRRRDRVPPTTSPAPRDVWYVYPCGCSTRNGALAARCDGRDCYLVKSGRATS